MADIQNRTLLAIIENIPQVFWVFDPERIEIVYVNAAYETVWGRTRTSLYRRPLSFMEAIHSQDKRRAWKMFDKQWQCQPSVEEFRVVQQDGTVRWIHYQGHPIKLEAEGVVYIAGIADDITESYQRERKLHQRSSVEQLAKGVAHDFNSVLTDVMGNGEFLLRDQGLSSDSRQRARRVVQAAIVGKTLANELIDISSPLELDALDLNLLISNIIGTLRQIAGPKIEITTELSKSVPQIRANQGPLTRVVMNLVTNARDAMPLGGQVTIATHHAETDEWVNPKRLRVHSPSRYTMMKITDNGCGIEFGKQAHIFEPYYTTKNHDAGTGLGLYIVKRVVDQCHAHIRVSSKIGEGTTFYLYFPEATPEDSLLRKTS